MPERCAGIVVGSDEAILVDAQVPDEGPITILSDQTFRVQQGEKPAAYARFHETISNYIREQSIERVFIKGSALSTGSTKLAHLDAAELRGVVIGATASIAATSISKKAALSKTFGKRKIDEYVNDGDFWEENISAEGERLRKGSREAAILIIANRQI